MNKRIVKLGASTMMLAAVTLWSQDQPGAAKQALQERIAELKQSMAANQAKLRTYQWVETTEVSLKGEIKKREQKQCRYGPDGKVQKTPIGEAGGGSKRPQRGLRGKIVEKKVDELKDYMERVSSLVSRYVPPDPQEMRAANAGLNRSAAGIASLVFQDYAKPGDKVTFAFDTSARKLQSRRWRNIRVRCARWDRRFLLQGREMFTQSLGNWETNPQVFNYARVSWMFFLRVECKQEIF